MMADRALLGKASMSHFYQSVSRGMRCENARRCDAISTTSRNTGENQHVTSRNSTTARHEDLCASRRSCAMQSAAALSRWPRQDASTCALDTGDRQPHSSAIVAGARADSRAALWLPGRCVAEVPGRAAAAAATQIGLSRRLRRGFSDRSTSSPSRGRGAARR